MPRSARTLSLLSIASILILAACGSSATGNSPTSPGSSGNATTACSASVTAAPPAFSPYGSSRAASVSLNTGCAWTASTTDAWISIASGASGSGSGSVTYAVAANTSAASRTGTLTIAGKAVTIAQAGLSVPAPGADNYIDFGTPADETFHALAGWGQPNPGQLPAGIDPDLSSRYLEITNTADLIVSQTGVPYILSVRSEDGGCDDSFDVLVNGTAVYSYKHRTSPDRFPLHRISVPASLITGTTVHITFKNTSVDACGHSAIYFARMDS